MCAKSFISSSANYYRTKNHFNVSKMYKSHHIKYTRKQMCRERHSLDLFRYSWTLFYRLVRAQNIYFGWNTKILFKKFEEWSKIQTLDQPGWRAAKNKLRELLAVNKQCWCLIYMGWANNIRAIDTKQQQFRFELNDIRIKYS